MLNQTTIFINLLITFGSLITIYGGIKNINYFSHVMNLLYYFSQVMNFFQENNPLILDYSEYYNNSELKEVDIEKPVDIKKPDPIYDDKYLEKFKIFPNEFKFSDLELELERHHFELIKSNMEKNLSNQRNKIEDKILKIKEIYEKGCIEENKEFYTEKINDFGKNALISYFDLSDDEDEDFEELFIDLIVEKIKLEEEMKKLDNIIINEEEMKEEAHNFIINKKLDSCIDNYVLECTPLGNIYMRYNNNKNSFEYFSNNTIPYRYLEPVGRKYVMTYWCKPIFVDIEEELKKSEEKYLEEKNNNNEDIKNKFSKIKSYNKENSINSIKMTNAPSKNRGSVSMSLPPQIKSHLLNVNSTSEKILLKEKANRYTWEGRLNSFSPLKKIDKKIVNKNLSLSFADFKKMQKNKK
jgi:hypothetical protein